MTQWYWVNIHAEVVLESRNSLPGTSAISDIIEIPLERLFHGYSEQNYEQIFQMKS